MKVYGQFIEKIEHEKGAPGLPPLSLIWIGCISDGKFSQQVI
jgi:hypothetical protein